MLTPLELELIWFAVFVILLMGYAILDGFDLGVGIIHLFSTEDRERRLMLNTIGPVWDGNEVWLVTAGGALFAGFPNAYATFGSAFYTPLMVLLTGIIFRAVAIEFRSKAPMAWWRWMWDVMFSFASLLISACLGLVIGNLIRGIPLDASQEFTGDLFFLLNPYALLVSLFTVSLFSMHGTIYVLMKTEEALHDKIRLWINPLIISFIMLYAFTTVATLIYQPHMSDMIKARPIFFVIAFLNMLVIANIPREIQRGRDGWAFICSCANIALLMLLYGIGTFPHMIRAINAPQEWSVTVYNAASSQLTLQILLIMAIIGIPLVISYTIAVYWIFRGKVRLEATSY